MFNKGKYLCKTIRVRYLLVNANTSYNILLGQSSINHLRVMVSTPHLPMKFPLVAGDIITVHVDKKIARECYVASLKVEPTNRLYRASPRSRSRGRKVRSPRSRGPTRDRSQEMRSLRRVHMVALVDLDPQLNDAYIDPDENLRPLPHVMTNT